MVSQYLRMSSTPHVRAPAHPNALHTCRITPHPVTVHMTKVTVVRCTTAITDDYQTNSTVIL